MERRLTACATGLAACVTRSAGFSLQEPTGLAACATLADDSPK